MVMHNETKQLYEFGPFRLDVGERLLIREGRTVPLPPKVFDTLLTLVENSGRILGKEELMQLLWPNTFVEESNLTQNISQLRRALSEGNGDAQYIETIPKRGYRFAADVKTVEPQNGHHAESSVVASGHDLTPSANGMNGSISGSYGNGHQTILASPAALASAVLPVLETTSAESSPLKIETVEIAQPVFSRKRAAMTIGLLMVSLLILALALWVAYRRSNNHGQTAFRNITPAKLTTSGKALLTTISRDGKYAAFVDEDGEQQSLWVRQVEANSSSQVVAPAKVIFSGATFSPDGNFIYYSARPRGDMLSKLFLIPLLGGIPREVM